MQEYVLPDYKTVKKGFVRGSEQAPLDQNNAEIDEDNQVVKMTNDRFSVPEVLFNPNDIGINQAGIAEAIVQTVEKCPPVFHRQLYANIFIAGGNSKLPGFAQRVRSDLELIRPQECKLGVIQVDEPSLAAWRGLKLLQDTTTIGNQYQSTIVTK